MRRHQDRAFLRAQFLDQVANLETDLRIESGGRFVEKEHLRIVDKRERESEALLLSAGKRGVIRVFFFPKLKTFQQRIAIDRATVKRGEEFERLVHRNFVRQIRRLQTDADAILQLLLLPVGIESEHRHFAGAARPQTFENFNRRRLAGAVRAEQAEDFARVHFEIDSLHRFESAVGFAQALNVE